ncbi:MAG: Bug family tripartite tricarboxylate transporter substrate binding protein [Xanthobacteraceae bacterium]
MIILRQWSYAMGCRYLRILPALAILIASHGAWAQNFPSKPITLLFGLPAGGAADTVARQYGEIVSASLGQRIVVEAKPGAGGIIAANQLLQTPADGHTIMIALGGMHTIAPWLQKLPFDAIADFEPITLLFSFPTFLAVPADSPAKTVADLVAMSKTKPGGLDFGSQGLGSPQHLIGVLFQEKSGIAMTTVQYKGATPLALDLMTGRVDFAFSSYAVFRPQLDAGKLRILAVAADKRWERLPDVQTFAESGFPGVELDTWFGLVAPRGTPAAIIQKLHDAFAAAARDEKLVKRLDDEGLIVRTSTPLELVTLMKSDSQKMGRLVQAHGIKIEP